MSKEPGTELTLGGIRSALSRGSCSLEDAIATASSMLRAYHVLIPTMTGGVTKVSAPASAECWDKEQGVKVMGQWYDTSHIVPDWATRRAAAAFIDSLGGYSTSAMRAVANLGKEVPAAEVKGKVPAFRIPRKEPV